MMRDQEDYRLFVGGKYGVQSLSNECSTNVERMLNFVEDCVSEFKLFVREDDYIWSDSLLRRMQKREKISENNQKAGKLSAEKRQQNQGIRTSVQQLFNECSTNVQRSVNGVSTLKERKEKKIKEKQITHSRPMVELVQEEKLQQNQGFQGDEKSSKSHKCESLSNQLTTQTEDTEYKETKRRQKVAEWFLTYISIHPKKVKRFLVEQIWFEIFLSPALSDPDAEKLYESIITALRAQKDKHPRNDPEYRFFPAADAWLRDGRWMDEVETKQPETLQEQADRMKKKMEEDEAQRKEIYAKVGIQR